MSSVKQANQATIPVGITDPQASLEIAIENERENETERNDMPSEQLLLQPPPVTLTTVPLPPLPLLWCGMDRKQVEDECHSLGLYRDLIRRRWPSRGLLHLVEREVRRVCNILTLQLVREDTREATRITEDIDLVRLPLLLS